MNEGDIKNHPDQLCKCGHRRDVHMTTLTCCKWVKAKTDKDGETIKIAAHCKCLTFRPAFAPAARAAS